MGLGHRRSRTAAPRPLEESPLAATSAKTPDEDPFLAHYQERTQHLIEELLQSRARGGDRDARGLAEAAHAAVLEEAGWELRQVLTHLRGRLELAQLRKERGQEGLTGEEIAGLLQALERASAILDVSMDRNETAKRMIPVTTVAFDLAEALHDWLHREGLLDEGTGVSFPMDPAPVRGDPVKLAKAIGSMVEHFHDEARDGEEVLGELAWEGDRVNGFVGLSPSHLSLEELIEQVASPVPVGDLRFNLALVRAVLERHDGHLRVQRKGQALGFSFELPALENEVTSG